MKNAEQYLKVRQIVILRRLLKYVHVVQHLQDPIKYRVRRSERVEHGDYDHCTRLIGSAVEDGCVHGLDDDAPDLA